ncbi:MAG TPA: hypothetical protein VKQ71_00725 [Acidimicrobiales bacterium]|nr:hypothetical protein [Acidimicrobiales bacterium]
MHLQNLLYVVVAILVATVISAWYVLRHRKPKSLEAGIESFSRELKALAPERTPEHGRGARSTPTPEPTERFAGEDRGTGEPGSQGPEMDP